MRWLANENFPGDAVDLLRSHGHDVSWVRVDDPGLSDTEVLDRAMTERRILLTFDKDFGRLVFQAGRSASCGIVLFRISTSSSHAAAAKILHALEQRTEWEGCFSTVDDSGIRTVVLPSTAAP
jgi:predicted nuclease of predicted toxin-antitoxin system